MPELFRDHVVGSRALAEGKCGRCGSPLEKKMLLDPQDLPNQPRALVQKGETDYCDHCKSFWTDEAKAAFQAEGKRMARLALVFAEEG